MSIQYSPEMEEECIKKCMEFFEKHPKLKTWSEKCSNDVLKQKGVKMELTKEVKEMLRKSAECCIPVGNCPPECPLQAQNIDCASFTGKGILALMDRVEELESQSSNMDDLDCLKEVYINLETHCYKMVCEECPYHQVENCSSFVRELSDAIDKNSPQQYSEELVVKAKEILKRMKKEEAEEKLDETNNYEYYVMGDRIAIKTKKMDLVLHRDIIQGIKLSQGCLYMYIREGFNREQNDYYCEKLKIVEPSYDILKKFLTDTPK